MNALEESGRITASVAPGHPEKAARSLGTGDADCFGFEARTGMLWVGSSTYGSTANTETLPLPRFVTTRLRMSGEMRARPGCSPGPATAISRRASRSITLTEFEPLFAT